MAGKKPKLDNFTGKDIIDLEQFNCVDVKCRYCGKAFNQKRHWQYFCSSDHRNKYWNERNLAAIHAAKGSK